MNIQLSNTNLQGLYKTRNNSAFKSNPSFGLNTTNEIQDQQEKPKQGFVQKYLNFISSCRKAGTKITGFTKGIFAGVIKGFAAGSMLYACLNIRDAIFVPLKNKRFSKNGISKVAKSLPDKAKSIISIAAGLGIIANSLYRANLKVNRKIADLDHTYMTGHNKPKSKE